MTGTNESSVYYSFDFKFTWKKSCKEFNKRSHLAIFFSPKNLRFLEGVNFSCGLAPTSTKNARLFQRNCPRNLKVWVVFFCIRKRCDERWECAFCSDEMTTLRPILSIRRNWFIFRCGGHSRSEDSIEPFIFPPNLIILIDMHGINGMPCMPHACMACMCHWTIRSTAHVTYSSRYFGRCFFEASFALFNCWLRLCFRSDSCTLRQARRPRADTQADPNPLTSTQLVTVRVPRHFSLQEVCSPDPPGAVLIPSQRRFFPLRKTFRYSNIQTLHNLVCQFLPYDGPGGHLFCTKIWPPGNNIQVWGPIFSHFSFFLNSQSQKNAHFLNLFNDL